MAVIKNMMVRAGADFSPFVRQSQKAAKSMRGMQISISRSCAGIKASVGGMKKVLGGLGIAVSLAAAVSAGRAAAEAYDQQAEAEMKLATVMRNTMRARNAEIQSVLNLVSAQQRLGVIGDEVQLAGAQELATYLMKTSTLKKLIPVMNDMAAQQYGYNVTAENTTTIATMLGKVMNVSRYGLEIHPEKTKIHNLATDDFTFLKKRVHITDSGRIVLRLTRANIRREEERIRCHREEYDAGRMPLDAILQSYQCWRGYAQKYNAYGAVQNMDKYFTAVMDGVLGSQRVRYGHPKKLEVEE